MDVKSLSSMKEEKMKTKGKVLGLCVLIVCVAIAVFYYLHRDSRMILGTWNQVDEYGDETGNSLTFDKDGTVWNDGMEGSYELDDGEITMTYSGGWDIERYTFEYELDGNQLTLTHKDSGSYVILIKQEEIPYLEEITGEI